MCKTKTHARLHLVALLSVLLSSQTLAAEGDTTTITVTGTIVDAPQCTVNGSSNTIEVPFGTSLVTRKIDGIEYMKDIVFTLVCASEAANTRMKLSISSNKEAGFGAGLIGTNKTGLGIQLYHGAAKLGAGVPVNFSYPTLPVLRAVPVAQDNATLTGGPFTGSGTLVIAYQ